MGGACEYSSAREQPQPRSADGAETKAGLHRRRRPAAPAPEGYGRLPLPTSAAVVEADAEKTLRLVFARSVGSEQVASSFAERLAPAVGKDAPALKAFKGFFTGVKIDKGTVLTFSANKGTLLTAVDGKQASLRARSSVLLGDSPSAFPSD